MTTEICRRKPFFVTETLFVTKTGGHSVDTVDQTLKVFCDKKMVVTIVHVSVTKLPIVTDVDPFCVHDFRHNKG